MQKKNVYNNLLYKEPCLRTAKKNYLNVTFVFVLSTSWRIPEHRSNRIFDRHLTRIFESFRGTILKPTFTLIRTNAQPRLKEALTVSSAQQISGVYFFGLQES